MKSVWQETTSLPSFPRLEEDIHTDVLIIGGGIAGILTAYRLKERGIDCVVAEKGKICSGVTGNTTAKITAQHGLIYAKLLKSGGKEAAQKYLVANEKALEQYEIMSRSIDCDFERKDSYVYSLTDQKKLTEEVEALQKIGFQADYVDSLPLPIQTVGAVRFPNQAQFHVLKFLSAVCKDLNIYENTFVREMIGTEAVTDRGKITAKRVVAATHFPFINKHGLYSFKLYQHRSYVIALENAADVNGMYVDESKTGLSFRNYKNLLLLGGGGHRTGKKGGNWNELREFARTHYPKATEKTFWSAQDCMSLDSVPYIGQYSKNTPDFFVATGFNKWGMTSAMAAADILADLLTGRQNDLAEVFSPSRSMLKPQLLVNGFESIVGLLTPSTKRCPHMGCALKRNEAEHSWDCSCHGSRFSSDGKVLDNPANGDLKNEQKQQ
ncbi:MAG: FAD-dependent oxidoreductase [Oscillospiraceae bacterium]|nr:FAD-dependent oxidoreductase [Oscillospiraceae bacterium]